jgi:oligopeptide transport system substrate-binding protein
MTLPRQLLAVFAITGLLGCSAGESNVERGNREGIFYLGNGTEPQTIDPHVLTGTPEAAVANAVFEPLVRRNPYTLDIEAGVAERWEFNADKSAITFHLNPAARWSNGDPVTAQDFVWSWQRALNPIIGNQIADIVFYSIRNAEGLHRGLIDDPDQLGATAVDDHTLRVDLEYPDPFVLLKLSYVYAAPVHRATVEAHGKATDRYSAWTRPANFVGNGAFAIDEWKMQRFLSVKKNPHYWDRENVALNGMVFRPIESATTVEKMFRSGQLHMIQSVPNSKVPDYRAQPDTPLMEAPFMGSYFYLLNTERPPLDDVRVRRALALSVHRDQLTRTVLQDTAIPWANYVPFGMPDYEHPQVLGFDPEEARRLLAEAGFPDGEGFPELTLKYNTQENHRSVAMAIQQMWKEYLNIEVELANEEWRVYLDTMDSRNYDIARLGWVADTFPGSYLDVMTTDSPINRTGFSNARFDAIVSGETKSTGDKDRLLAMYREAERILLEETPIIPVYSYKSKLLVQPSIEGIPANLVEWVNYKYIKLDPEAPAWKWQEPMSEMETAD